MSSYQNIKNHVGNNLRNTEKLLNEDTIQRAMEDTQAAIQAVGLEVFAKIIGVTGLTPLSSSEWTKIQRELETEFNVKMKNGILIQGLDQQDRDSTWWTGKEKQQSNLYYWERYKEYLKKDLPPEVVKAIDIDTDIVMDNIENPEIDDFSRYGMVVGHVQSGKTANYSSLICKAADAGYKFIVVIAGGINNLRDQTQARLNEAFVGMDKGQQIGAGVGNAPPEKLPISLTTVDSDFNKQDADSGSQSQNFDNSSTPVLLVIKKNTHTLSNVIHWLESQYKNKIKKHAMLMIDDESDYASINTKNEEDPTTINKKLRKLLSLFNKSAYIAYTATPYANIFIDHEAGHNEIGKDLFPKDFIYTLDAPSNYFGARKIFLDTNNEHLIEINDFESYIPLNHKKDNALTAIPPSLKDAMRLFLLNVAIRHYRGQGDRHNSMLIHATRFTAIHQKLSQHAEEYISSIRKDVNAYGKLMYPEDQSDLIKNLKTSFGNHYQGVLELSWFDTLSSLCQIIDSIIIREVHQKTSVPLEYRKDRPSNVIVIGGTSVSRGYTLEGLSVSYFLRSTIYYDTLMQMGRWFGYRGGYEDLCRIYMSNDMADNFECIIEATEDLIADFREMGMLKKTPNDFGLAIKQRPESALQITARNKQKNIRDFVFEMNLDGHSKETSWLRDGVSDRKANLIAIERVVANINNDYQLEKVGNSVLWKNCDKKHVQKFLTDFLVYQNDPMGIGARMPIAFVKEYAEKKDVVWDIALYSGNGDLVNIAGVEFKKEKRRIVERNGFFEIANRQVSTGSSESIALTPEERKELGSDRKETRARLKNPLLMLHILQTNLDKQLASFGISFPGASSSTSNTVRLKINTVYYNNLLEDLGDPADD